MRHLKARQYEPFDFPVRVALNHCRFESVNMALQPKVEERKLGSKKKIRKDEDTEPTEDKTFQKKAKPLVAEPVKRTASSDDDDDSVAEMIAQSRRKTPIVVDDNYQDLDDE
jgi:hypothetical protein